MRLLILVAIAYFDFAEAGCILCEKGVDGLKRPGFFVDAHGTVCAKKMMDVYRLNKKSSDCTWEILQYREMCCGEEEPKQIPQTPTKPPASQIQHTGPHPVCDICWNYKFPGRPSMVINMLNVGTGSCKQFFEVGRAGKIVPHMCDTLQVSTKLKLRP